MINEQAESLVSTSRAEVKFDRCLLDVLSDLECACTGDWRNECASCLARHAVNEIAAFTYDTITEALREISQKHASAYVAERARLKNKSQSDKAE